MAFTEDVPLCETRCVSVCFAYGENFKSFAAVSIYTDNLLPSNIPKKCITFNACYVSFNTQTCYIVATLLANCIKCRERGKGEVVKRKV